jgi:hypothetical protein
VIRFQIGQFGTTRDDALEAVAAIADAIAKGG